MMHPIYPTLCGMVATATIEAERAARLPIDPGELERRAYRTLSYRQGRLTSLIESVPELACKRVLALLSPLPRGG